MTYLLGLALLGALLALLWRRRPRPEPVTGTVELAVADDGQLLWATVEAGELRLVVGPGDLPDAPAVVRRVVLAALAAQARALEDRARA